MPDYTFSRPGQIQASGDDRALFLKLFAGEVLTTFERKVVTAGNYMEKRITSGKSHQFPALSRATAKRFSVGDNILNDSNGYLSQIKGDERVINVDSPIISSVIISDFDEALNHFETRQEYVTKLSEELAHEHDTHILSVGIAAARTDLTFSHSDYVTDRTLEGTFTTADALYDGLMRASLTMDSNDVPSEGRVAYFRPAEYYLLMYKFVGSTFTPGALTNADFGSNASFATARLTMPIAGFEIRMTKNLPSTDKSANSTDIAGTALNDVFASNGHGYNGDFSATKGLCLQKSAVGSVRLWDVNVQSEYRQEMQGDFTLARMAEGHGVLRPECAVELVETA